MKSILLGTDEKTDKAVTLPVSAFDTHIHMPGATGKGKTTCLLTMLYQLLAGRSPYEGRTGQEVLEAVAKGPPSPLESAVAPELHKMTA